MPAFLLPDNRFDLPGAAHSAVCQLRVVEVSDRALLVARYATEDLMQADLARNGVEWYCFAAEGAALTVIGPQGLIDLSC